MLFTEWSIYYAQGTKNCQGERRREDVPKAFCIYRLLSDQLAQPEWTVDALQLFVLLNDWVGSTNGPGAAETAASFVGSGVGDCCILRGLWSRRLLHPSWALESETAASFVGSGVGDCRILRGLWSRRLPHPSWALESETAASFVGSGVGDCCILRRFWSRRLLHPSWALESETAASSMGSGAAAELIQTWLNEQVLSKEEVLSCSATS